MLSTFTRSFFVGALEVYPSLVRQRQEASQANWQEVRWSLSVSKTSPVPRSSHWVSHSYLASTIHMPFVAPPFYIFKFSLLGGKLDPDFKKRVQLSRDIATRRKKLWARKLRGFGVVRFLGHIELSSINGFRLRNLNWRCPSVHVSSRHRGQLRDADCSWKTTTAEIRGKKVFFIVLSREGAVEWSNWGEEK